MSNPSIQRKQRGRPGRKPRTQPIEPMEMTIGQPEDIELPITGALGDVTKRTENQSDFRKFNKVEMLAFQEEKIVIRVHENPDQKNPEPRFLVSVNGRGVWIERGIDLIVARKYAEKLFRSKVDSVRTEIKDDYEGNKTTLIRKSRALAYPFSIIQDLNPLGVAWAQDMMANG